MGRFIGTDTASIELFFQHIHLRNWDIYHTVGPNFVSLCRRSLPPGIGATVWHTSPPLSLENADRTGISWGVRKDRNHWMRGSRTSSTCSPVMMDGLQLPSPCTCSWPAVNCLNQRRTICLLMTLGLYTWHGWRISIGALLCALKNCHRPQLTLGGSWNKSLHLQSLQRWYCENSGSPASACVMLRHYSYVNAVASRNKWFTSCGTSGKFTLWTSLVWAYLNRLFEIRTR